MLPTGLGRPKPKPPHWNKPRLCPQPKLEPKPKFPTGVRPKPPPPGHSSIPFSPPPGLARLLDPEMVDTEATGVYVVLALNDESMLELESMSRLELDSMLDAGLGGFASLASLAETPPIGGLSASAPEWTGMETPMQVGHGNVTIGNLGNELPHIAPQAMEAIRGQRVDIDNVTGGPTSESDGPPSLHTHESEDPPGTLRWQELESSESDSDSSMEWF